jgi:hypothetical protein
MLGDDLVTLVFDQLSEHAMDVHSFCSIFGALNCCAVV